MIPRPGPITRAAFRLARRRPLQPLLGLLAIALGLAVVVGVDAANASAHLAFDEAVDVLSGKATHRIVPQGGSGRGLDESLWVDLRVKYGRRDAVPVVQGAARLLVDGEPTDTLQLRGIDPLVEGSLRRWFDGRPGETGLDLGELLTDPRTAVLGQITADRLGLGVGDTFTLRVIGRTHELRVVSLIDPVDEAVGRAIDGLVFVDLATAQERLDRVGELDRIDLQLLPERVEQVRSLLPDGLLLEDAREDQGALERLTRAFRFNLTALSGLALLVGAFLVHQAIQFRVVLRRESFAVLRAIGATRRQVLVAVLGEAAVLSLIGSVAGTALGLLLADLLLGTVSTTIQELYSPISASSLQPDPLRLALFALSGMAIGTLAAIPPALEATRTHPEAATRRSTLETRSTFTRGTLGLGAGCIAVFGIALALPGLTAPFVAVLAALVFCAIAVPASTRALLRLAAPLLGRSIGAEGRLAARGAEAGLSRTGLAVAALATAVATTLGVDLMVGSFRRALTDWLQITLVADAYVSVPARMSDRTRVTMDRELLDALSTAEGVEARSTYRRVELETDRGPVEIAAIAARDRTLPGLDLVRGPDDAATRVFGGDGLLVSEPLAQRIEVDVGDSLRIKAGGQVTELPVHAVFRDYATERGYAMIADDRYRGLTGDEEVTSLALWTDVGRNPEQLVSDLRRAAAPFEQDVVIRSSNALREASLSVFDRTFAITNVLRLLCVVVAFVGTLAALLALQFERRLELAVLRALGATPGQVVRGVVAQNLLLGLCAGLLAIPIGLLLAWLLVEVIQPRTFGWTLPGVTLSLPSALAAFALAPIAALLASPAPALSASKSSITANLHDE